jgi:hypothetical protein
MACIVLVILTSLWQHKLPPAAIMELIEGIVPELPQDLATAKGVDVEVYSLARVGQSEEGISSSRAKIAVMYATLSHANQIGSTVTALVTKGNPKRSDYDQANGRYGRQGIHPYCSTIAAPTKNTLALAASVYDQSAQDETEGAEFWDNPLAQAALHIAKPSMYKSPDEIAAARTADGLNQVNIDGVSTRFWKR